MSSPEKEIEKKPFSKTVYVLSFVSLFADISSELLYPVLPMYLQSIGFNTALIGFLEGLANLVSGLSKSVFGRWSDVIGKRMPFVWTGYIFSTLSKGLIGVFVSPIWIFLCRTVDRLGKGIRTSARDAILADEADKSNIGAVFGFHRALDTTGAFIGPILALIFLWIFPGRYQPLFLLALVPLLFIVPLLWLIKDKQMPTKKESIFNGSYSYWKRSHKDYRKVLVFTSVFTLVNSSDVFLLLKAKETLQDDLLVISCYIFYNAVYAGSSMSFGHLSDRIGASKTFALSLLFFAMAYVLLGISTSPLFVGLSFLIYGLFSAASEGISKAWISVVAESKDMGEALGYHSTVQSICSMLASAAAGLLWNVIGPGSVLAASGIIAFFMGAWLFLQKSNWDKKAQT